MDTLSLAIFFSKLKTSKNKTSLYGNVSMSVHIQLKQHNTWFNIFLECITDYFVSGQHTTPLTSRGMNSAATIWNTNLVVVVINRGLKWQLEQWKNCNLVFKDRIKKHRETVKEKKIIRGDWPACSWEILTVGREEIFSFSAGGGPVFSSWPSNYTDTDTYVNTWEEHKFCRRFYSLFTCVITASNPPCPHA